MEGLRTFLESFTRLLYHEKGSGSTDTSVSWQIPKLTMVKLVQIYSNTNTKRQISH